jgi:hypothetical protein
LLKKWDNPPLFVKNEDKNGTILHFLLKKDIKMGDIFCSFFEKIGDICIDMWSFVGRLFSGSLF